MKRIAVLLSVVLSLSLLAGCQAVPPVDEEFQAEWKESMEELRKDWQEDEEDGEDSVWSAWMESWEAWGADAGERFSDEGKLHRWKVLDAEGTELCILTDEDAVEALDDILLSDSDGWDWLAKDPGEPAYTYVYSQQETLKAGQDPGAERAYEDLLTFTVSGNADVVTVQILGGLENLSLFPGVEMEDILTFHVSVPAETAENLRDYSRFLE